jgi:hypothetical protein
MLGQPNASNSTWTDYELTEYINEAIRMYFAEVVVHMEGYFTISTDPASGGSGNLSYYSTIDTVALPTDCFQVKAVYIQRNQGWSLLEYRNDVTHGFWTTTGNGDPMVYQPYYMFLGNSLLLRPAPNMNGINALRLDYIQMPDQLINGGDTMTASVSPVFKQLIETYAIFKAKMKQSMVNGTDLTAIPKANLQEIYGNFKNTITPRSAYPIYTDPFNPEIY